MENVANGGLSIADALKQAITRAVPDAKVEVVSSGGGHYSLEAALYVG